MLSFTLLYLINLSRVANLESFQTAFSNFCSQGLFTKILLVPTTYVTQ